MQTKQNRRGDTIVMEEERDVYPDMKNKENIFFSPSLFNN